jgi:hypothetical protein
MQTAADDFIILGTASQSGMAVSCRSRYSRDFSRFVVAGLQTSREEVTVKGSEPEENHHE